MPPPDKSSGPQAKPEGHKRSGRLHSNQHRQDNPAGPHSAADALRNGGGRGPL